MKIPATVVTGFLGAGKTTLLRHLIAHARGRRLALIINEFGDLGFDREMLLGCGIQGCGEDDIIELPNGCICCTVADAFLPTIERILDGPRRPDHIVIETSGLALPKPLVQAFNWPDVRTRVTVDGVLTVVDAPAVAAGRFAQDPMRVAALGAVDPALDHDQPLAELFEDQIACADMVVLNKTDGVDGDALARVRTAIGGYLRPATRVVATRFGALDPRVALGLGMAAEDDLQSRPSRHEAEGDDHDHDDFTTFVLDPGPVALPEDFVDRLRAVAREHDILRIKGFVHVPGKPRRLLIQAVGGRVSHYYDRPWADGEEQASRLIVIAERGIDDPAVRRAFVL
jgi:cobalamin biosynthesis protein CobW